MHVHTDVASSRGGNILARGGKCPPVPLAPPPSEIMGKHSCNVQADHTFPNMHSG